MNVQKNKGERVLNREVLITNFETGTSRPPSPDAISQTTLALE